MGEVIRLESVIEDKYNPQFIMENRPSDEGSEIIAWLESEGLQKHMAQRCYDTFIRGCLGQLFKGVKLVFKPGLTAVDQLTYEEVNYV